MEHKGVTWVTINLKNQLNNTWDVHNKFNHLPFLCEISKKFSSFSSCCPMHSWGCCFGKARGVISKKSALSRLQFRSVCQLVSPNFLLTQILRKEKGSRFTPHQPPPRTKATQASKQLSSPHLPPSLSPSSSLPHQLFQNPPFFACLRRFRRARRRFGGCLDEAAALTGAESAARRPWRSRSRSSGSTKLGKGIM